MALFDQFADNYDEGHTKAVALSGFKPSYFHEYKCKEMKEFLKAQGGFDREIKLLNYGCGTGNSEKYLRHYLPNASIYSTDISEDSIRVARDEQGSCKHLL